MKIVPGLKYLCRLLESTLSMQTVDIGFNNPRIDGLDNIVIYTGRYFDMSHRIIKIDTWPAMANKSEIINGDDDLFAWIKTYPVYIHGDAVWFRLMANAKIAIYPNSYYIDRSIMIKISSNRYSRLIINGIRKWLSELA